MDNQKVCIAFVGPVGSSKSPIAYYISHNLNLPIINNDSIRTEVTEDFLEFNEDEYIKRRNERGEEVLKKGTSFIYDASFDRNWEQFSEYLTKYNYRWFIISLDPSKELLTRLYKAKGYKESFERIDQLLKDHEDFLANYSDKVGFHINDYNFKTRLPDSLQKVKSFLTDLNTK